MLRHPSSSRPSLIAALGPAACAAIAGLAVLPVRTADPPASPCVVSAPRESPSRGDADARRARFVAAATSCLGSTHEAMHAALAAPGGGDANARFAAAMIAHHQGAVDMARQLLLFGDDPELRAFARGVIVEQRAEIAWLRSREARWARARPDPSRHASRAATVPATSSAASEAPTHAPLTRVAGPISVSARDRVYTGDQVSNTVSVIDPSTDRLLGQIRLGNRRPNVLSPLYGGETNVHGLGFSPDGRILAAVSTGTNSVALIETATNRVRGIVYVGRNPHEAFFTPDGRELWVAVRGEDYLAVIDPATMRETRRIRTANGPSMVVFRPDGKLALVDHSFSPELDVVDVASGAVLRRVPVVSPFSPNLAVTADGAQVWLTHKDVGRVTVVDAHTFAVIRVLDTGPVTNHVTFAGPGGGSRAGGASAGALAYVSVCGENAVKAYRRRDLSLAATIPVGACPHGIWSSGDGMKVYVGLQEGDGVDVIDVRTNRRVAHIPIGQSPQALVYVPDAVPAGAGRKGLAPLAPLARARTFELAPPPGPGSGRATVWVRSLGPVDGVDVSAAGLAPSTTYTLFLRFGGRRSHADWPLATVSTDPSGGATLVEAIAPTALPEMGAAGVPAPAAGPRLVLVRGTRTDGAVALVARAP